MLTKKNTLQNQNSKKLSNCISAVAAFAVTSAMAVQAFAATGLSDAILNVIKSLGALLNTVFTPLCVLVLGWSIVTIMIGKSSKSADEGISWAKRAVGCFVVFFLLGSILTYGVSLFPGTQYDFGAAKAADIMSFAQLF